MKRLTKKEIWTIFYRAVRDAKGWKNRLHLITEKNARKMLWYANRVYNSCH